MKNISSLAVAFSSHGEIMGTNKYKLIKGYINHKCPANVGKLSKIRDKLFKDVLQSNCPHISGSVLYNIIKKKNGGNIRLKRLQ